jgi:hypothetical protein
MNGPLNGPGLYYLFEDKPLCNIEKCYARRFATGDFLVWRAVDDEDHFYHVVHYHPYCAYHALFAQFILHPQSTVHE